MDIIDEKLHPLDPIFPEMDQGNVIIRNDTFLTTLTMTMSTIGITIAAAAVVVMLLTAILFEEWRKIYKNQLLIQFMISKFAFTIIRYFIDITITFNLYEVNQVRLYIFVFFTFYTEAALVIWMFVFTKQMYNSLVKVFNVHEHSLWKVSVLAWILPIFPAVMLYASVLKDYRILLFFLLYVFVTKWPVMLVNAFLLIQIMRSILSTNKGNPRSHRRIIIVMIALIFNFSFQQLIIDTFKIFLVRCMGRSSDYPFEMNVVIVTYSIFSLYYCAFTIFFWLFGNKQTRKLWKFGRKPTSLSRLRSLDKPGICRPMSAPNPMISNNPVVKKQLSVV